jgi:stage V sporulation protein AB
MSMMWVKHILMAGIAYACGMAVSAGSFAFLLVIGVLPRMIKKTNLADRIFAVENSVILGVVTGAAVSVIDWEKQFPIVWLGHFFLALYGLSSGIFVGCIAVALAEILNTFPILFRRMNIKRGLQFMMLAMALGKMVGSLFYFFFGYGIANTGG